MSRRGQRLLWGLLLLDFLKHLLLLASGFQQPWPDSDGYWRLGADVAGGDLWLLESGWGFRTPGYPWFLGLFQAIFSPRAALVGAILVQHLAAFGTDLIVAFWTRRLTGSNRAMLGALAACVVCTARPLYANWILTETLATACLVAFAAATWSAWARSRTDHFLSASILAAVGTLIRPSLILTVPLVLGVGLILSRRSGLASRQRWWLRLAPLVIAAAILCPWIARNGQLFGRWTLVTFTGRELWTTTFSPWPGAGLEVADDGPGRQLKERLADLTSVDLRHNWSVANALSKSGLNDADLDAIMQQASVQSIRSRPAHASLHVLARMATFWYCHEYPAPSPPTRTSSVFPSQPSPAWSQALLQWTPERTFLGTWIFSALTWLATGWLLIRRDTRVAGLVCGYLLAGTTLLTAVFEIPMYRYRLPLEPIALVAITTAAWTLQRPRIPLAKISVN
jgi:hypothetical protein